MNTPFGRASSRTRQLASLATYLPRVGRWSVLPAAALVSAAVLGVTSLTDGWGGGAAITDLRLAVVMLAAVAGYALDDQAADTLASSPTVLRIRRGASLMLVAVAIAGAWLALLALAAALLPAAAADACLALVAGPLTWELITIGLFGLTASALVARRLGGTAGGTAAGPAVVLGFFALVGPLDLLPGSPLDPRWSNVHERLWIVALGLVGVIVWATKDPWRPLQRSSTWRPAAASVAAAAVLGTQLWNPAPAGLEHRLDATLADLVAAQGITALTVTVEGPGVDWARRVGADGSVTELTEADRRARTVVGALSVGEVGSRVALAGAPTTGSTSPNHLTGWVRGLASARGELEDRVAASPPAGLAWVEVDPDAPVVAPTALTEVRTLLATGTVVTVMTGDGALPPCGLSVADALSLVVTG